MTRLGSAVLIGTALAMTLSGVAAAEEKKPDPVKATVSTGKGIEIKVKDAQGRNQGPTTAAISLTPVGKDKASLAYCIDFSNPLGREGTVYQEQAWATSGVKNLQKIQWVLTHGYPTVSDSALLEAAKAKTAGIDPKLVAYAGTQVAIWNLSDGIVLEAGADATQVAIKAIYDYLLEKAAAAPSASDPKPTLTITPATAKATVGDKAGPFTVAAPSGDVALAVSGGKLVDQDGKEITKVANGGKFWVTSDKTGTYTVTATGTGNVPSGRIFVGAADQQKIILAGTIETTVTATATATFEESKPTLPVTGASVITAAVSGIALLVVGGGIMLTMRRRRIKFTA